jgi:glyoxylase-like metal-dependent hydrolase (beta-lactamase superfamily II)
VSDAQYTVDVLIPTARFAFSVRGDQAVVLPEHRSPEAFRAYRRLKTEWPVVGMTTWPNTVLLRGPRTILVDPGAELQGEPVLGALAQRGLSIADIDLVALTHTHSDHAAGLADIDPGLPVAFHEAEMASPYWAMLSGVLGSRQQELLRGEEGELAPGVRWRCTPGHTEGSVCFLVATAGGLVVLAGDTVGPLPEDFAALRPPFPGPDGERLVAAWRRLLALEPALIVPGHIPPFAPAGAAAERPR